MIAEFEPGSGLLFMKVGTHANETLEDIIRRKQQEISDAGVAFWGYGGNTCHPTSMVQPFAERLAMGARPLILAMQPMNSKHFAEPVRAAEYSVDGIVWERIPERINALGSRFALVLDSLEQADLELPLDMTRVAIGRSSGKPGSQYISGRVDKACLEVVGAPATESKLIQIGLVARVAPPYAVFLRN